MKVLLAIGVLVAYAAWSIGSMEATGKAGVKAEVDDLLKTDTKLAANVLSMAVIDDRRPHKIVVMFIIRDRINGGDLGRLSTAVREGAGEGYNNYFVTVDRQGRTHGHYATAHHTPNLKIAFFDLTANQYRNAVRIAKTQKPKGETIIADAIFDTHIVILKTSNGYVERQYALVSGKQIFKFPLHKRNGHYWRATKRSKQNYKIADGMLEIYDDKEYFERGYLVDRTK